jgi:hypothetical protein
MKLQQDYVIDRITETRSTTWAVDDHAMWGLTHIKLQPITWTKFGLYPNAMDIQGRVVRERILDDEKK